MKCPTCGAENPEPNRYCGACGSLLGAGPPEEVRHYLDAELGRRLKDQRVVEVETAQAVVDRLSNWAKLFGYFVGIPLAVAFFVLGFLGFNTYSRINDLVEDVEETTRTRLQEAEKQVEAIRSEGRALEEEFAALRDELASLGELAGEVRSRAGEVEQITRELRAAQERTAAIQNEGQVLLAEYEDLRAQLADVGTVAQEVQALAQKVQRIEERIAFEPGTDLAPDQKSRLERSVAEFRSYLEALGYEPAEGQITVRIEPGLPNAYYQPTESLLVIGSGLTEDLDAVVWTYANHALSKVAGGRFDRSAEAIELMIALSDYFVCSFTGDPRLEMGGGGDGQGGSLRVLRDLSNTRKLSDVGDARGEDDYARSLALATIWGGAFWSTRERLGQRAADQLLFSAWAAVASGEGDGPLGARYVAEVLERARRLPERDRSGEVLTLFAERELPV